MNKRALLKLVWPSARADSERLVRWAAGRRVPRMALNAFYNRLSLLRMGEFHARFAKLFRENGSSIDSGAWSVSFRDRAIRVPLRSDSMWLDWDSALSMLGHEPETKSSYEAYIDRFGLPHCFFDVGANYGLHSMLFLAHGVDVVSFEPNVGCHEYMERLEYLNDVQFCIESCAVGSHEGIAELCYPEWDTWLGTVDPGRSRDISSEYSTRRVEVPCDTLDAYARRTGRVPELIKIDTEGSEYDVLLGASDTLRNKRPVVIFESWRDARRIKLWELLNGFDYAIVRLPLQHPVLGSSIEQSKFCDEPGNNFATVPSELL